MALFTRQHHEAVAKVIASLEDREAVKAAALRFAMYFNADNSRFHRVKFFDAVGLSNAEFNSVNTNFVLSLAQFREEDKEESK